MRGTARSDADVLVVVVHGGAPARPRRAVLTAALPAVVSCAGLLASVPPAAEANGACAPRTTRSFFGTLAGQDGRAVNATIGFDIQDRTGRLIDGSPGAPPAATGGCWR